MASFGKHTRNPGYNHGSHWVVCDRCGFDYYVEDVVEEWTGAVVCKKWCYEPRHPQDFVRGIQDDMSVKGPTRPASPIPTDACSTEVATAGTAIAGCAIAGLQQVPQGTFDNSL